MHLLLSGGLSSQSWEGRHQAGEVPDRWPYGIHRLEATMGLRATARSRIGGLGARVGSRFGGGFEWVDASLGFPEGFVSWDERRGVPAALSPRRHGPAATGVIWLTDPLAPRVPVGTVRRALRRCDLVWALSSAQLQPLRTQWGVPPSRLAHLVFGVDADFWSPRGDPEPGQVLIVGNDRHRDHAGAVDAVALAHQRDSRVRAVVVSRHPVEVPAEVGTRTSALGHADLRDEYRRGSVCVTALRPNLHCSGITSILESMACGRPVVATATAGMSDYVDHGKTGLLTPPGDVDAMATAITTLVADPDMAAEMGAAGRRQVEAVFNTSAMAERLGDLLADHLGVGPDGADSVGPSQAMYH